VPETVADTGPILHLHEIGRLEALSTVAPLTLPGLVIAELGARGLGLSDLLRAGITSTVAAVETDDWEQILLETDPPRIQPADAQVFTLVQASRFQALTLTDDLTLRRLLEAKGATVVGSVGILVRAYSSGNLQRKELEESVDALIHDSSLHLSRAFRLYLGQLLIDLP
jgi:predicted nucleic acid-binding protein